MPRKKTPSRTAHRTYWTKTDVLALKRAAGKHPLGAIARMLKRTEAAVQLRASLLKISLRVKARK